MVKVAVFGALCAASVTGGYAADSSYVEALQAEVDEFETGKFNLDPKSPWIAKADAGAGTTDLEGFTKFLRRELPGTYILFVRLPKSTQMKLFENYVNTGDLGKVRGDIYDLLYRKRKD